MTRPPDQMQSVPRSGAQIASPPNEPIRALAERQHGVVARRQLLAAGITGKVVEKRLASGHLLLLHRGVYAVGHRQLRREGRWLAAVLAGGAGAALSHREAAALHGIRQSNRVKVDVTAPRRRPQRGIDFHHAKLDPCDVTTVDGIPTTTVARTLVDLANLVPRDHLAKALREAERMRLLDTRAIDQARARTGGRHGAGDQALKQALDELAILATTLTRSHLEVAFLKLVRSAGLPTPRANVFIDTMQVDACWPDHRLVVELDGWANHHTRTAFQDDRTRDVRLTTAGYQVMRFTHADVTRRPAWVAQAVRQALAARPAAPA
jgi:very-short-patch-repair endonuclease